MTLGKAPFLLSLKAGRFRLAPWHPCVHSEPLVSGKPLRRQ